MFLGTAKNSTDASDLTFSSAIIKQIDATWANGSAAGGGVNNSFQTTGWYDSRGKDG